MKLLVIGGTKFVGRAIVAQARAAGHDVIRFHRGETDADADGLRGDVDELKAHADALRSVNADAVIHCIAYSEQHGRDLVDVLGDHRLIVLSSCDCYDAFWQIRHDRDGGCWPIDEGAPLCAEPLYWSGTPHRLAETYDKNAMTQVVQEAGAIVLRLPMVYGPRDRQFAHRHGDIIHHILDGRERYIAGAVELSTMWSFGYVDNVAAAVLAATTAAAPGSIYNIAESSWRTKRRWASLYAEAAGVALDICAIPDEILGNAAVASHLVIDAQRIRKELDFVDPIGLRERVQRTLSWAREHRDALGEAPDYQKREALLAQFRAYCGTAADGES